MRHPNQVLKLTQMAPFNAKEQQLYSESLADVRSPHPVSQAESRHPTEGGACRQFVSVISFLWSLPTAHEDWNLHRLVN